MTNVVHLNFSKPGKSGEEHLVKTFTACGVCKNKTFTLMVTGEGEFPLLVCACCGVTLSRIGYVADKEET